ncbi:MAG: PKD domain-containing protein [Verrucomicrobia bacterium]|nr:PKD domain-containing protein [Verrucomicrobiota bacterium]
MKTHMVRKNSRAFGLWQMLNHIQFVRQTATALLAFGLIVGLLPGLAAAQDLSTREATAEEAVSNSQIHHREHNLLLDATLSGNMDSFNKGLRRFDGGECQPKFLVYDFKKQDFLGFSRWVHHKHKRLASKTDWYAYGVAKDANLGVVPENKAAYWMAEWEAPVSTNFITLTGSYPDESSQANTAWKIELRSNGQWRVHAQGVGGWYDRGQYFWGGRNVKPIQFDALRVKLYSRDGTSSLSNIHFRAQENRTWMVAFLPAINARIAVTQQVPRAGQTVNFAGNQVFGKVQSWQWDFGDGKSATGQTVSHTFANPGTYDVTLTLSGAGQSVNIVERVTIHPAVEAQITPLPGSVLQGNAVIFDASHSYGAIGAYQWDFGDGSTATGKQVTKSFSKAGIYQVTLKVGNSTGSNSCSALVRVHTPATVNVPQVLLDSDVEEDDIYTIAYALYSELDVLGMTAVHHGGEDPGMVAENYERILHIIDLARQSGLPATRQPMAFRGADAPLIPPYSDNWHDTEPIVTEASEAILAAARGASPDNPVWVTALGPISNVACAILQAWREGWEAEFRQRIRVCWLGAGNSSTRVATWNGRRDAWAAHIVAQSGIEFLIMPEPVGIQLKWDRRDMKDRYPKHPLGDYLYQSSPDRNAGWYDPTALAAVISIHANKDWFSNVEPVTVGGRYEDYRFASTTAPTNVRLIRNIDADAMRNDIFETLNGSPTKLRESASGASRSRRGTDGGK